MFVFLGEMENLSAIFLMTFSFSPKNEEKKLLFNGIKINYQQQQKF